MTIEKNSTISPMNNANENKKGTLHYISFKFLFLSLYMIVFYYVFLNKWNEYNSLIYIKSFNVCSRNLSEVKIPEKDKLQKSFFKNEKRSKKKNKVNKEDANEKNSDESKSFNGDSKSNQVENENKCSTNYINYKDISVQLTKEQLFDVLNSITKVPPKENLTHLWNQTLGVNKELLDILIKDLLTFFPKNKINDCLAITHLRLIKDPYVLMWFHFMNEFGKVTLNETDFTRKFYDLIKGKPSIDDIRNYIFSFLETFQHEYNEIYDKCKREVLLLQNNDINTD
ncbi:Plasmodium exported protein (PHISTa), unknown, putative [Plasmodium sp.]|nr:Plasmodium exported protein (PHISTa), unknown, putative [Plasmodium sp.]